MALDKHVERINGSTRLGNTTPTCSELDQIRNQMKAYWTIWAYVMDSSAHGCVSAFYSSSRSLYDRGVQETRKLTRYRYGNHSLTSRVCNNGTTWIATRSITKLIQVTTRGVFQMCVQVLYSPPELKVRLKAHYSSGKTRDRPSFSEDRAT